MCVLKEEKRKEKKRQDKTRQDKTRHRRQSLAETSIFVSDPWGYNMGDLSNTKSLDLKHNKFSPSQTPPFENSILHLSHRG